MAQRKPRGIVIPNKEELLKAAHRRVSLPPGELGLDYQFGMLRDCENRSILIQTGFGSAD
jgi:hypothetical protein